MAEQEKLEVGGKALKELRVVDLKLQLDQRGLSKSGTKTQLIERLKAQLLLEKLQKQPVDKDQVPNISLQKEAGNNEFLKQYFEQQQKQIELQREARKKLEEAEQSQSAGDTEDSQTEEDSPKKQSPVKVPPKQTKAQPNEAEVKSIIPPPAEELTIQEEQQTPKEQVTSPSTPAARKRLKRGSDDGARPPIIRRSRRSTSDASNKETENTEEIQENQKKITEESLQIVDSKEKIKGDSIAEEHEQKKSTDEAKEIEVDSVREENEEHKDMESDGGKVMRGSNSKEPKEQKCVDKDKEETKLEHIEEENIHENNKEDESQCVEKISDVKGEEKSEITHAVVSTSSVDKKEKPLQTEKTVLERLRSRSSSQSLSSRSRSRSTSGSRSRSSSSDSKSSSSSDSDSETQPPSKVKGVAQVMQKEYGHGDTAKKEKESYHTAREDLSMEDSTNGQISKPTLSEEDGEKAQKMETEEEPVDEIVQTNKTVSLDVKSTENQEKPARKRKWGSTRSATTKKASVNISTDSLKGLIPEVKKEQVLDLGWSDDHGDTSDEEDKRDVQIKRTVTQNIKEDNDDTGKEIHDVEEDTRVVKQAEPVVVRRISHRKPSLPTDEPKASRRSASPARNPVNKVVHVENLVRPFTLGQLKEMLKKYGSISEDDFWIDKIKSHCYIVYSDVDAANSARKALHNSRWPSSSPKILKVEYASMDELNFHRDKAGELKKEVKEEPRKRDRVDSEREERRKERESRDTRKSRDTVKPLREWDRDKIRQSASPPRRSRSRSRDRERRRRERSKERRDRRETEKQAEEVPAKLLDDLFRKTKATPSIYWLPLTEEQIVQKEKVRLEREKEREKRRKVREEEEEAARKQRMKEREERRRKEEEERSSRRRSRSRSRSGRRR